MPLLRGSRGRRARSSDAAPGGAVVLAGRGGDRCGQAAGRPLVGLPAPGRSSASRRTDGRCGDRQAPQRRAAPVCARSSSSGHVPGPSGRPGRGAPEVTLPPWRLLWVLIQPSSGRIWPPSLEDERWRSVTVDLIAAGMSNLTYVVTPEGGSARRRGDPPPPADRRRAGHRARHGPRAPGDLRARPDRRPGAPHAAPVHRRVGAGRAVLRDGAGGRASTSSSDFPPGYADEPEQRRADRRAARRRAGRPALGRLRRPSGLGEFGRPEGFAARQVRRWTKQWDATRDRDRPGLDALAARLAETVPAAQRSSIVHGDYRLDNCLLDPDEPGRIKAVLDWEMSTLGDPLTDLGMMFVYWPEAGEERASTLEPGDHAARLPHPPRGRRAVRPAHRRRPVRPQLVRRLRVLQVRRDHRRHRRPLGRRRDGRARTRRATRSASTRAWSWDAPRWTTVRSSRLQPSALRLPARDAGDPALTQRTERPPVRARSGRRPIPPLIFLLVLALAAAGVWWNVLQQGRRAQAERGRRPAPRPQAAPPSLDPATVSVRVLNATDRGGLAQPVAGDLQRRGFTVAEIGNDDSGREVTGAGEVRHGPRGTDAAAFVAAVPARRRATTRTPAPPSRSTSSSARSSITAPAWPREDAVAAALGPRPSSRRRLLGRAAPLRGAARPAGRANGVGDATAPPRPPSGRRTGGRAGR